MLHNLKVKCDLLHLKNKRDLLNQKIIFRHVRSQSYFLDMKVKCNLLHQMNNCYLVCQNVYFNAKNHALFSLIKHFTFHAYELRLDKPIKSQVQNRHNNNCKHMLSLEGSFSSMCGWQCKIMEYQLLLHYPYTVTFVTQPYDKILNIYFFLLKGEFTQITKWTRTAFTFILYSYSFILKQDGTWFWRGNKISNSL